jgi:predicted nucleic acid-binding protein
MIALDTNVLIYACDKADLKRQQMALDLVSSPTFALPSAFEPETGANRM